MSCVRLGSISLFCIFYPVVSLFVEGIVLSPLSAPDIPLSSISCPCRWGLIYGFSILFYWPIYQFLCQCHALSTTIWLKHQFEIKTLLPLFFSLRNLLYGCLGPFVVLYNIQDCFLYFCEKYRWNFFEIALNLQNNCVV